jgi:hypothetical protein
VIVARNLTGIAFIDVGWHRRTGEKWGFPPTDEAEIQAHWEVEDDTRPEHLFEDADFDNVEDAIAWARERAPEVLVRLGPTEDDIYSAGVERAMNGLSDEDDPDAQPELVAFPEWPPDGWDRGQAVER